MQFFKVASMLEDVVLSEGVSIYLLLSSSCVDNWIIAPFFVPAAAYCFSDFLFIHSFHHCKFTSCFSQVNPIDLHNVLLSLNWTISY